MSDDEELRLKRAKKPPKHEYTVILLDVGSNMAQSIAGTSTIALDLAKEIVDWILTRKIFTQSSDEFVLVLFGSEETKNPFSGNKHIFFCEDEMQRARIDWLRFLEKEVKPCKNIEGDFLAALIDAVNFMRSCLESAADVVTGSNILLVSNLAGHKVGNTEQDLKDANAAVNGITALNIDFNAIGPNIRYWAEEGKDLSNERKSPFKVDVKVDVNASLLADIIKRCKGVTYSFESAHIVFSEALPMLRHFVPRHVTVRGQRFMFEVGENIKLPLLLYKKVQPADMSLKFRKVDAASSAEIKRETIYERVSTTDEGVKAVESVKREGHGAEHTFLTKDDVVKGYTFGATIVPFNDADKKEYGWKKETRSMRLMQFTKRSEILQHYLMDGSAYYCLPPADDKNGCVAVSALVRALIEEDCVAITRYVYNAASQPRLFALFPRISNKGVDMFVGIQLPFYEDFRGLEFPSLEDTTSKVKDRDLRFLSVSGDQKRAMEAFISAMDLSNSYFNPETGEYDEDLRPKNVPNPKLQRLCEIVKFRALHPGEQLPEMESRIVDELLVPRTELAKIASEPLSWIEKSFTLHEVKKAQKESEEFEDFIDNSLPGFGNDECILPDSGRFITNDALKEEKEQ